MNHYYQEIQGYFDWPHVYREAVAFMPEGGTFVEIGCWRGQSLAFLLVEARNSGKRFRVVGVDHFTGSVEDPKLRVMAGQHDIEQECQDNLERAGYPFELLPMPSIKGARQFADASLDYVFIDGSHDYESIVADLAAWGPKVKPGGILAGHDINQTPVRQALQERFGDKIVELPNPEYERGFKWGLCWRRK